jgi:hypothetical protein
MGKTAKILLPFPAASRGTVHNKMRLRSRGQVSDVESEQISRGDLVASRLSVGQDLFTEAVTTTTGLFTRGDALDLNSH